ELIMNGRDLPRPVNYGLVRILPPPDIKIDPQRHPFIIFDPCAGQGPGISGIRPDLVGPIILAGEPLSYWAGVHGKNPMRYLGGVLGGTCLTSPAGDL